MVDKVQTLKAMSMDQLTNLAYQGKNIPRFIQLQTQNAAINAAQQAANTKLQNAGISEQTMKRYAPNMVRQLNPDAIKKLVLTDFQGEPIDAVELQKTIQNALLLVPQGMKFQSDKYGRIRFDKGAVEGFKDDKKGRILFDKLRNAGAVVTNRRIRRYLKLTGNESMGFYPGLQVISAYSALKQAVNAYTRYMKNPDAYVAKKQIATRVRLATKNVQKVKGFLRKKGVGITDNYSVQQLANDMNQAHIDAAAKLQQAVTSNKARWDASRADLIAQIGGGGSGAAMQQEQQPFQQQQQFQQQQFQGEQNISANSANIGELASTMVTLLQNEANPFEAQRYMTALLAYFKQFTSNQARRTFIRELVSTVSAGTIKKSQQSIDSMITYLQSSVPISAKTSQFVEFLTSA